MSLQDIYKEAGVVMKPAAMKDGKLYSQQPHSGAGDFNFSRADGVQTRINKHGLIETVSNNEPRLSYDIVDGKVSDCPHLLLEPSRTNIVQRSQEFDSSYWGKSAGSVTANQIISPDGSKNADIFVENTSTTSHLISKSGVSISSGASYTLSVFAKANGRNTFRLFADTSGNSFYAFFNLETGSIGSKQGLSGSNIEDYGNGWYRCSITFTSTSTSIYLQFLLSQDNEATSYLGDGSSGLYFYGAQLEAGSYATSYIPTSGSTETRQADICNGSGNSETFNDSEGVLFAEIAALANDGTIRQMSLSDGTTSDRIVLQFNNTTNQYRFFMTSGGSNQQSNFPIISDITSFNKIAYKYEENNIKVYINGTQVITDTSATMPEGLSELAFDSAAGGNNWLGKVKELTVINEALTDEQLQLLTTP